MLDATLKTTFTPGTNLKGDVTGANWVYLLPSLQLGRVAVLGAPGRATLRTLAGLCDHLSIALATPRDFARVSVLLDGLRADAKASFEVTQFGASSAFAGTKTESIDLLLIADKRASRMLRRYAELRDELRRVLKRNGTVYFETRAATAIDSSTTEQSTPDGLSASVVPLWLTPLAHRHEMRTATLLADDAMIGELLMRNLDSRSVSVATLRAPKNQVGGFGSMAEPAGNRSTFTLRVLRELKRLAKRAGRSTLDYCGGIEHSLHRSRSIRNRIGRIGNLAGGQVVDLLNGPPRYLCKIARESGVDIEGCRWAFAASGEYSSRKMLFLLFDREVVSGTRPAPRCLVKMTRDSRFNSRLEREYRALRSLKELGIGSDGTLPRALFAGTEGGLQVVGETFVDGVPFDARTTLSKDCPLAASAIEWLTRLGETSAQHQAADPEKIAEGLVYLKRQFAEIFAVSPEESRFLDEQLERVENCDGPIPLVFQHGDPGRWNVFATSENRAAFLDWESAEPDGLPLWDLFYFLRSFGIGAAAKSNSRLDVVELFDRCLLDDTSLAQMFVDSVTDYVRRIGLDEAAVEPLFYTCWMHRALKEATRLPAESVRSARYFQLFRLCVARRNSPMLKRLFSIDSQTRVSPSPAALWS